MLVNDNIKLIWYWIETVYALVQRFFGYKKDASKIPKGAYCYVIDEERNKKEPLADGGRWIKTCPYFRSTKKTGGIACTYLGFFGFDCLLYEKSSTVGNKSGRKRLPRSNRNKTYQN